MSVLEWIYLIFVEGLKYIIIGHFFFGYEFREKKTKYLLLLYPLLIPVVELVGIMQVTYLYKNFWKILILLSIFYGNIIEKLKGFFIMSFMIAIVDTSIIVPISWLVVMDTTKNGIILLIGCAGLVLWGILAWKAKKLQKWVREFWRGLSVIEYAVLLVVLFVISFIIGGIQGNLYCAVSISEQQLTFAVGLIAMIFFAVICVLFFWTIRSREKLKELNRVNMNYLELQRKYYEESLKQYEDMRSFRHDINHHIYVISQLSHKNKIEELKEYIDKMSENYETMRGIHTGNFVADCIISHAIRDLKEDAEFFFEIDGRFSEKFFMETMDFCILLSNVFENAREALEKVAGKKVLQMEIKHYRQWLYIIVRNATDEQEIDFLKTSKRDTETHGYGTQNIRRIVEKYKGSVQWLQEGSMVEVKMKFVKKETAE